MAVVRVASQSKLILNCLITSNISRSIIQNNCLRSIRKLSGSPALLYPTHDAEFEKAKVRLNSLKEDPGSDVKLKMYGLFKQATQGKCNAPKPGMMDLVGKAKWNAWNDLGSLSQDDAQKTYIDLVNQLAGAEVAAAPENLGPGVQYENLKITRENKIFQIQLNRPTKKNAITWQMYKDIGKALKEATESDAYSIAVLTGSGDYYCSGNDLSNFTNIKPEQIPAMAKDGRAVLEDFVNAFIDFPKPLIALVNGPAVGISVTTLGLCDAVYCSDIATFHTPFSALGQAPEACSSYIFPKIMGYAKANELLLFNRKITAAEAKERNFVSDVFPNDSFQTEATKRILQYSKCPPQSLRISKVLVRSSELQTLKDVNKEECRILEERWQSQECLNALVAFFSRKS